MITERELWACANHYVQEHGGDAPVIASMRCDELLEQSDHEGVRVYLAIITRIHRLLDMTPDGPLH